MNKSDGLDQSYHCGFRFLNSPITSKTLFNDVNSILKADFMSKSKKGDHFPSIVS